MTPVGANVTAGSNNPWIIHDLDVSSLWTVDGYEKLEPDESRGIMVVLGVLVDSGMFFGSWFVVGSWIVVGSGVVAGSEVTC